MRYFLIALLLAACAPVRAHVYPEASIGIGHYRHRSDGTWYDSTFPHKLKTNQPFAAIGMRADLNDRFRLHLDAVDLGHYKSDAQAIPMDWAYVPTNPNHCATDPCPPLAHYMGHGSVYGVQALVELHTKHFGFEIGPLAYRESWAMDIPDWYNAVPDGVAYRVTQRAPIHTSDAKWVMGAVAGVTATAGRYTIALDYYKDASNFKRNDGHWPPGWASTVVLSARVAF